MNTDILQRFRDGVASRRFTLTQLAKISGLPLSTLSDMSDESWRPQIFEKLERLERGLNTLEREVADQPTQSKTEQSREPVAN